MYLLAKIAVFAQKRFFYLFPDICGKTAKMVFQIRRHSFLGAERKGVRQKFFRRFPFVGIRSVFVDAREFDGRRCGRMRRRRALRYRRDALRRVARFFFGEPAVFRPFARVFAVFDEYSETVLNQSDNLRGDGAA